MFLPVLFSGFLNTINEVVIVSDGMSSSLWPEKLGRFGSERCFQFIELRVDDVLNKSLSAFVVYYFPQN
jgi:hypothetical protein